MYRLTLSALLCVLGAVVSCVGDNVEQPWRLHEARVFHAKPGWASVEGESHSDFFVVVPLGVDRQQIALAASDSLVIGRRATVHDTTPRNVASNFGVIASSGHLELGREAQVGPTYALGTDPLVTAAGARIDGYAKTAVTPRGPLTRPPRLGLFDHGDPAVEEFRWTIDFGRAAGRDRVGNAQEHGVIDLEASHWGHVVVDAGSTVRVHGGQYTFDSLEIRDGGVLEIDNTSRAVYLWIRSALALRGSIVRFSDASNVMLGYAGDVPPAITTAVNATIVAPYTTLELPRTNAPHVGAFFARSIVVDDGASVEHASFTADEVTPGAAVAACASCTTRATLGLDACCALLDWRTDETRADVGACLASCSSTALEAGGCRSLCGAASDRGGMDAEDSFRRCTEQVVKEYDHCEEQYGYRAGTCGALGLSGRPAATCGGE